MKICPRDQWGRISCIAFDGWSIIWQWPRGKMAWFVWNEGRSYRIGPVTVAFYD